jgi:prepilin peptidase CpaA
MLHLSPLAALLAVAVAWDLASRRIPNLVIAAIAVAGLGVRIWDQGVLAGLGGLGAAVLTIVLLFGFWRRGGLGGGDVKLAGAVAIWIAPLSSLPWFYLASAVAGGLVSVVCLALSRANVRREVRVNLTLAALHREVPEAATAMRETAGRVSVPYGLAIALGAAVVLLRG